MLTQFPGFVISKIMPTPIHIVCLRSCCLIGLRCMQGYISLLLPFTASLCLITTLWFICLILPQLQALRISQAVLRCSCLEVNIQASCCSTIMLSLYYILKGRSLNTLTLKLAKVLQTVRLKTCKKVMFSQTVTLTWSSWSNEKVKLIPH